MTFTLIRFITVVLVIGSQLPAMAQTGTQPAGATQAPIQRGSIVRLAERTPLNFQQRLLRTAQRDEEFIVLEVPQDRQTLYLSVIDKAGTEIAVTAAAASASAVGQDGAAMGERISKTVGKGQYAAALALAARWEIDPDKREQMAGAINGLKSAEAALASATMATAAAQTESQRTLRQAESTSNLAGDSFQCAAASLRRWAEESVAAAQARQKEAQANRDSALAALRNVIGIATVQVPSTAHGANADYLNDPPGMPEHIGFTESSPTYEETVAFINAKLQATGLKLWFGKTTKKMILTNKYGEVLVFDPAQANPAVKYATEAKPYQFWVKVSTSSGQKTFREFIPSKPRPIVRDTSFFNLSCVDPIDTEKVAKAMRHLIEMFGGKEDPF